MTSDGRCWKPTAISASSSSRTARSSASQLIDLHMWQMSSAPAVRSGSGSSQQLPPSSCCARGSGPGRCASGGGELKPAMSRVLLCRALEDNSPSVTNLLHFDRLHSLSGGREGPGAGSLSLGPRRACAGAHFLRAAALPPLAPAFFFCAVVPP